MMSKSPSLSMSARLISPQARDTKTSGDSVKLPVPSFKYKTVIGNPISLDPETTKSKSPSISTSANYAPSLDRG